MKNHHRALVAPTVALTLGALLSACTGSGADQATRPSSSTTKPPVTTEPRATDPPTSTAPPTTAKQWTPQEQEVIDAMAAAIAAEDKAIVDGNGFTDDMTNTHAEPLLSKVRNTVLDHRKRGERGKYPDPSVASLSARAVTIESATSVVMACDVDDAIVYKVDTGETLNDRVSTSLERLEFVRDGKSWKLSGRTILNKKEGASDCDAF